MNYETRARPTLDLGSRRRSPLKKPTEQYLVQVVVVPAAMLLAPQILPYPELRYCEAPLIVLSIRKVDRKREKKKEKKREFEFINNQYPPTIVLQKKSKISTISRLRNIYSSP